MLVISHANGIYKISVGLFTAQGRTLEKALKNALEKQNGLTPPDDLIYATASVLSTLVPEGPENTQIGTGGLSA